MFAAHKEKEKGILKRTFQREATSSSFAYAITSVVLVPEALVKEVARARSVHKAM
jgi:hypothetical protein